MVAEHEYTLKAPLELEGTDDERAAWSAVDELANVEGGKLSAAADAADELSRAGDALQAAADALAATPTAEGLAAAQQAQDAAAAAQDRLYERVDDIADDLGKSRDDVVELLQDAADVDADGDNVHPVNTRDNGAAKIEQAEKYAVYTLEYDRGSGNGTESITVYGVAPDSRYWDGIGVGGGRAVFGRGLVDKFGFAEGQTVSLYDKYADEAHDVVFEGDGLTWGSKSDMAVYMSLDDFNRLFGNDAGYFNAYASDQPLDLDARYLASDLTPADMDAIGEQFVGIMDDMIGMLVGLSVFIFLVFMYLLTKSVIDRSARAISYMKVFGYRDREISRLYVRSITLTVVVSLVACQPLIIGGLTAIFRAMLLAYSGNIEIFVPLSAIAEVIAIEFATYLWWRCCTCAASSACRWR